MRTLDIISINVLENISRLLEFENNITQEIRIIYPYVKTDAIIDKQDDLPNSKSIPSVFGYKSDGNRVFGYDVHVSETKPDEVKTLISKALIKKSPERRFLKNVGLLNDNQNTGGSAELPIIAFFKSHDNIIKDCIIEEIQTSIKNGDEIIETYEKYKVTDLKAIGHYGVINYIYVLTPYR